MTGRFSPLTWKAVAEMAADGAVGRRAVVDRVVGSREAVEPPRTSIEHESTSPWYVAKATYEVVLELFDNRVEIIGCARRTLRSFALFGAEGRVNRTFIIDSGRDIGCRV